MSDQPPPHSDGSQIIAQNVESTRRARQQAELLHGTGHLPIERVFDALAKPLALYALLGLIALWILLNLALMLLGRKPFDAPPFYYLDTVLAIFSLLTAVVILIVQARQGKLAEARAEVELQVNLLSEQKIAKLIELVEALRFDTPFMKNGSDAEVEAMKQSITPEQIMDAIRAYELEVSERAQSERSAEGALGQGAQPDPPV